MLVKYAPTGTLLIKYVRHFRYPGKINLMSRSFDISRDLPVKRLATSRIKDQNKPIKLGGNS